LTSINHPSAFVATEERVFMHGKMGVSGITVYLVFMLVIGNTMPVTDIFETNLQLNKEATEPKEMRVLRAGTPHAPIAIDGDANFTLTASNEGWPGDGSSGAPFIIDGLDIDRGGGAGHCITIINTRVNFTIQNCIFTGANVSGAGINIANVTNAELIRNICGNNIIGINLLESSYNVVGSNNCSSNSDEGIRQTSADYNNISDNICNNNGMYGIYTTGCDGNVLSNNTCNSNLGSGIYIYGESNRIRNNMCINNGVGIQTGGIWSNVVDNTCTSNVNFGIHLSGDWLTLTDNTCNENGGTGILLNNVEESDLTHNECSGNGGSSISIFILEDSNFRWNTFWDGTGSSPTSSNTFLNNYYPNYAGSDTDYYPDGIGNTPHDLGYVSDPEPLIYPAAAPRLTETSDQIMELGTTFRYDLNSTYPGPFTWELMSAAFSIDTEGVVTSRIILPVEVYTVKVTLTNMYRFSRTESFTVTVQDTTAPVWMIDPTDQVLEYHVAFDYLLPAVDLSGIDHWELNDTTHFAFAESHSLDGSTVRISNASILVPGDYGLRIDVFDPYDNMLSADITITVNGPELDTTPPDWVNLTIHQTIEQGKAFQMQLEAWDASGIHHWWLNDTDHFLIEEMGVIRNSTILEVGVYELEVRAYDPYDNYCAAMFVLTVLESAEPTATTTSITTTTTTNASTPVDEMDPLLTLGLGAGIGGVAVIVIVIVFLRRKP